MKVALFFDGKNFYTALQKYNTNSIYLCRKVITGVSVIPAEAGIQRLSDTVHD